MCQQTSNLSTQSERNTRDITEAITAQSVMINQRFCDLEKRELQNKIDSLTADNALLRSNQNNMEQTVYLNEKFTDIQNQLTTIKASQPNTIPVQWPNIQAVNTTPSIYGYNTLYGYNNSGTTSFWN